MVNTINSCIIILRLRRTPLFLYSLILCATVFGATTHHFDIEQPARITANEDVTFIISARSDDNTLIKNNHTVKFLISSPAQTEEHDVRLKNGIGKIVLHFGNTGDYLISVVDEKNPQLLRSGSFTVRTPQPSAARKPL